MDAFGTTFFSCCFQSIAEQWFLYQHKRHNLPNQEHLQADAYGREDETKDSNPTITNSLQTFDTVVIIFIIVMSVLPFVCPGKFMVKISESYYKICCG